MSMPLLHPPTMRFKFGAHVLSVLCTRSADAANSWMDVHFPAIKRQHALPSSTEVASEISSGSDEEPKIGSSPSFTAHSRPVIGIDIEWRPVRKRDEDRDGMSAATARRHKCHHGSSDTPIALLQLAAADGNVLLLHTRHMRELPQRVADALISWAVLKVGVGIKEDARKITAQFKLAVHGCLDLGYAKRMHCYDKPSIARPTGLSLLKLASFYLGVDNWKREELTLSNWEADVLSEGQMSYAALDAWVSVAMYPKMALPVHIVNLCLSSSLDAPRPHYAR